MKKLTCIVILIAFIFCGTNHLMAQFIQTNGPYGGPGTCFAVSGTNLFAGTQGGGVFLSTNNGTSWTAVSSGLTNRWVRAFAVSGTNLFAGTDGGVFLSTNNGTSWTEVSSGLTTTHVCAFAVSGTNLFAGTDGGVFLSPNLGKSWTWVGSGLLPSTYVSSLAVSDSTLFAGASGHGVWRRPLSEMIKSVVDFIAPELIVTNDSVYQAEFIEVKSSEDGIIYLVPEDTNKDLISIHGVCIDSVAAIADNVVSINISGLGNGKYWLYARDESNNISEYKEFTFAGVSIENIFAEQIRIFPVPTSKLITIKAGERGDFSFEIISVNGQIILSRDFIGKICQVDLSPFRKGIYFITIRSEDFVSTKKIIKL